MEHNILTATCDVTIRLNARAYEMKLELGRLKGFMGELKPEAKVT